MLAGKESSRSNGTAAPPSALLTATTRVLHFVMPRLGYSKHASDMEVLFITALGGAMSTFSDSLPDKLLLCACLAALDAEAAVQKAGLNVRLSGCKQTLMKGEDTGILHLIATTLDQAMQVGHICHCCTCFVGFYSLRLCPLQNAPVFLRLLRMSVEQCWVAFASASAFCVVLASVKDWC